MVKELYVPIIKEEAEKLRKSYGYDKNAVIGDYIFTILKNECVLIQQPDEKLWDIDGLSTQKVIQGQLQTVVYINSAKNNEKQIFCAAHELGHQRSVEELIREKYPEELLLPTDIESIMNRFAAELLMPEDDFRERTLQQIKSYGNLGQNGEYSLTVKKMVKIIIYLMDFYYVPYKAVLYRLEEIKVISRINCQRLEKYEKEKKDVVTMMIQESGITRLRTSSKKAQISVPIKNIEGCIKNPQIMRYMGNRELKRFLESLGVPKESIEIIQEMQEMEIETITIKRMEDPETV